MERNVILNAMEQKALDLLGANSDYTKRGMFVVEIRDEKNPNQWESTQRVFGTAFRGPITDPPEDTGVSNDATAHCKIAYTRRTGKNSGAAYYDIIGREAVWKGCLISADKNCICSFSGFTPDDDVLVADAGIAVYESRKN